MRSAYSLALLLASEECSSSSSEVSVNKVGTKSGAAMFLKRSKYFMKSSH